MKFKFPHLQEEYEHGHPNVWGAVQGLDNWSFAHDYPEVVVTCVDRSLADQQAIYGDHRFSWHLVRCAVDIRNSYYSPEQLAEVLRFLNSLGEEHEHWWEILSHDVGKGSHIHIGYEDPEWREKFKDRTILHEDHQA